MAEISFDGKKYALLYNGNAFFKLRDMLPEGVNVSDALMKNDFETHCRIAAVMAEQGELDRRADGHEKQDFLNTDRLLVKATATEALAIQFALIAALTDGLHREKTPDENEDIDLGLAELSKKKE
ncbi:MAG: hypothetical protein LBT12_01535 [Oscillospiraceae bacterium]|jgi:hypothetical protein|nr:hypothetical protein [Oscillospiraceae bacterium]